MRIPKKVKIGPYNYTVKWVERLQSDDLEACYGLIRKTTQEILLDPSMQPDRAAVVFLHEVLHGLDDLAGLGLTEEQTTRLAPVLYDFLAGHRLLREE